jgi:hypothetical protein
MRKSQFERTAMTAYEFAISWAFFTALFGGGAAVWWMISTWPQ